MNESLFRIIDANCNRAAEGLRVIEDIARFTLNDAELSQRLKLIRHELIAGLNSYRYDMINQRNTPEDVGSTGERISSQEDMPAILSANSKRSQEALRVLEEIAKIDSNGLSLDSNKFKQMRFDIYEIERVLLSKILRKDKILSITGLYPIIDTASLPGRDLQEITRRLISADVKIIQLRDKSSDKDKVFMLANQINEICQSNGVTFIVNDFIDVALAINADGVHLGLSDLPVKVARRILPVDKIIGCSVSTVSQALKAVQDGADYIAVGSIFPTISKLDAQITGLNTISEIRKATDVPVVAIGGISLENAGDVLEAGADSIAVISAIFSTPDIFGSAKSFVSLIETRHRK
jgi:thiamine-phosphate pyrophosphorylase